MNEHFIWIIDHVGKLNVQAALLAMIVATICFAGKQRIAAGWKSLLWMLVFLRLMIPAGPSSVFSMSNILQGTNSPQLAAPALIVDAPLAEEIAATAEPLKNIEPSIPERATDKISTASTTSTYSDEIATWTLRDLCLTIWLVVAVVLLARVALLKLKLTRLLRGLKTIDHPDVIQVIESVAGEVGLRRMPRLLWGPPGCSPAVCGWWYPTLILPADSTQLSSNQLRSVILHEFRHIYSADTLLMWLPRLMCSLFWFNPLLWWSSRKWHEERELACDEWVIGQIGADQKRSYLETLVVIATRSLETPNFVFTASIVSSSTLLERRIVAMKRFRPATKTSLLAGSLLILLVGAVGLTDAAKPEVASNTDSITESASPAEKADDSEKTDAPASQKDQALKPEVTFAQHVILWNETDVLTKEQLKERLEQLRSKQPVKPHVYHSLGYMYGSVKGADSNQEANERGSKAWEESIKLIGNDQWSSLRFLSRRGSGAVDRIRSQKDLEENQARSLKGRVIVKTDMSSSMGFGPVGSPLYTTAPAEGAQVVLLPLGEPADIRLRNGLLRDPEDEIWTKTEKDGTFQIDPASLQYDPVLLYGEGKYLTLILHPAGYRVINGQLAASDATYELLPWHEVTVDTSNLKEHEHVEIWITPEGAHEKFPGLAIGMLRHSDKPVKVKLPRGKGRAAYFTNIDDQWTDTKFRHPIHINSESPAELALPSSAEKESD